MTSRTFALSRHRRRRTREPRASDAATPADGEPFACALEHQAAGPRRDDAAPADVDAPGIRPDAPPLPHERDEHADTPAPPRAPIVQAQRDLAEGRVDTDLRRKASEVFERALTPRRR
ncbi:MAG: hypothetical protein BroJett026_19170 [Betaproteobacteria bacterium]|nr:MAG: hypothetical protein BroJett026_19170 [Betaproteobacteria bacterium]